MSDEPRDARLPLTLWGRSGEAIAALVSPPRLPWALSGRAHVALFRVADRVPLRWGLLPVLRRTRIVMLVRYLEGTLRYDELIIGRLARRGSRVGLFVDRIWVDSAESVSGGRRYWGLPKELAEFSWVGDEVHVHDANGEIVRLTVRSGKAHAPSVRVLAPGFGVRRGKLLFTLGRVRARLRLGTMRKIAWAPKFASLPARPLLSFDAAPFTLNIDVASEL